MAISMKIDEHNGIPVLQLSGRIKGEGDEKLQKTMGSIRRQGAPKIVIDVSSAAFIDSHGLGVIIYFHKILQNESRALIILNGNKDPESYMQRLIEITNLDKVLTVVKSLDEV